MFITHSCDFEPLKSKDDFSITFIPRKPQRYLGAKEIGGMDLNSKRWSSEEVERESTGVFEYSISQIKYIYRHVCI